MLIGRLDTCSIKHGDRLTDPEHCYVRVVGGEIWFTDNDSEFGCYQRIKPQMSVLLQHNAFCLGQTFFQITQKDRSSYLIHKKNKTAQQTHPVLPTQFPKVMIGRDINDNIPVSEDETMSVHHAVLEFDLTQRAWTIKDNGRNGLGSSNGTWIKLGPATVILNPGDSIRIGDESFLIFR